MTGHLKNVVKFYHSIDLFQLKICLKFSETNIPLLLLHIADYLRAFLNA